MSLCWVSQFIYCYAECHFAECRYAECHYAECRGAYAECHYAERRGALWIQTHKCNILSLIVGERQQKNESLIYIVSNLQVKQRCGSSQFIAINDNQTSNHLSI